MTVYNELMGKLDDAGLLFNVAEDRVTTASGIEIQNKKALINQRNGEVLSVVSNAYKTVTNEEIFSGFCRAVEASGLNATDAQVDIRRTASGSRSMVDFTFPHQVVSLNGDVTALQISALNSFDGSTRYLTKAGGLRMRCLNGQILGKIAGSYSSKHTSQLDVDAGAAKVIRMVEEFNQAKDYWGAMMFKRVEFATRHQVYKRFLNLDKKDPDDIANNSRLLKLMELDKAYTNEMGQTLWALYNVLTDYVSHKLVKGKAPNVNATRDLRVRLEKTLESESVFEI